MKGHIMVPLLAVLWSVTGVFPAGAEGVGEDEMREVAGARGVELATSGTMYLTQGEEDTILIEARSDVLPHIRTRVRNGILVIDLDSWRGLNPGRMVFHLHLREIDRVEASSSGDIYCDEITSGDIVLRTSSSGGIEIGRLEADKIEAILSSSGDISLAGRAESQEIRLSSSGNYEAADFETAVADARLSSSGDAYIWVTDELNVELSSSGDLSYFGSPRVDTIEISSSGNITSIGEK
ncbi:MAG: head GIN domain-containing protein [Spirochaetia bacterium]